MTSRVGGIEMRLVSISTFCLRHPLWGSEPARRSSGVEAWNVALTRGGSSSTGLTFNDARRTAGSKSA